jgi:hypothetical protein
MSALLDYHYWLNQTPVPFGPSLVGSIMVFFGWFVVASIAAYGASWYFRRPNKVLAKSITPFANLFLTTGLLGWLFLFLTYEEIPFFGMRFWFLLLAIYFVTRLTLLAIKVAKQYPIKLNILHEREQRRAKR